MKKIILIMILFFTVNSCFAYQIPKGVKLQELLNQPYYVKSFDTALNENKPFLLVLVNSKYAKSLVRFIPIGEMVNKEFGSEFNFCIINTKMSENDYLVEYFNPKDLKQPSLYIVDTQRNKYYYINKKCYNSYALKKILKKYLAGKLF